MTNIPVGFPVKGMVCHLVTGLGCKFDLFQKRIVVCSEKYLYPHALQFNKYLRNLGCQFGVKVGLRFIPEQYAP